MVFTHHPLSQRSSSDLSKETLLEKDQYDLEPYSRRRPRSRTRTVASYTVLVIVYTVLCFYVFQQANVYMSNVYAALVDSPARPAVKNVKEVFEMNGNAIDVYFGDPPTPEIEDRWNDLIGISTFKFSKEEMTRWGRTEEGVLLSDDSGYMGTLNVFHEIHCLKRVYMYIHKDKYYGHLNLTEYEEKMNMRHTMHCLEAIRRGVQCRADISPVTYRFKPDWKIPLANWTSPHECKDWNSILTWAKQNSFDPYQPGLVVHPTLGPSYSEEPDMARKLGIELDHNQHHH